MQLLSFHMTSPLPNSWLRNLGKHSWSATLGPLRFTWSLSMQFLMVYRSSVSFWVVQSLTLIDVSEDWRLFDSIGGSGIRTVRIGKRVLIMTGRLMQPTPV